MKIVFFIIVVFLSLLLTSVVFAAEAPELPDDNLITNPWFRDATNTTASHDGWTVGPEWGLSQKNHNPTPDEVQGTSARLGIPKATFGVDSYIEQILEADPTLTVLRFQTWQVSRNLHQAQATIYGSESPDGPWEAVWQPWYEENSSVNWIQTPLVETTLTQGFPYYKVEFMCNYWQGTAGCKFTGVYFTAAAESNPDAVAVEDLPPAVQTGGGRGAADDVPSDAGDTLPNAAVGVNFEGVTATAVSFDQITVTWLAQEDGNLPIEIERSPDGRRQWRPLGTVAADAMSYTDSELMPETTYYYRLLVRAPGNGRLASDIVSATTSAAGVVPTNTPEPVAAAPIDTPEPAPPEPVADAVVETPVVSETETAVPLTPEPEQIDQASAPVASASPDWVGPVLGFVAGLGVAAVAAFVWSRRQS